MNYDKEGRDNLLPSHSHKKVLAGKRKPWKAEEFTFQNLFSRFTVNH
jgi:hypothetical protein